MDDMDTPFPFRINDNGKWEVYLTPEDRWIECEDRNEARTLSLAPVYCQEGLHKSLGCCEEFEEELEKLVHILAKCLEKTESSLLEKLAETARKNLEG
ncbi:MAG: hypothetical protein ACYS8W_19015 [Planctomycetota bacterium]|jgi:hypothetical protein